MKTRKIKIEYTDGTSETIEAQIPSLQEQKRLRKKFDRVVSKEGDIDFAGLQNLFVELAKKRGM